MTTRAVSKLQLTIPCCFVLKNQHETFSLGRRKMLIRPTAAALHLAKSGRSSCPASCGRSSTANLELSCNCSCISHLHESRFLAGARRGCT